jgi:hypothetical protein
MHRPATTAVKGLLEGKVNSGLGPPGANRRLGVADGKSRQVLLLIDKIINQI